MRFTDLPQAIGMDVYERTREHLKDAYAKTPNVVDLFEFGTIPLPGISDMDFHVVIKANSATSFPRMNNFAADERYAMLHKQFVLTEEAFSNLHFVDPWLIKGTPLLGKVTTPPRTLSEEEHHALSLYYILLNWLLPYLHVIGQIACSQELPVREMLEIIKGTAYPYREFNRMGVTKDAADPSTPFFTELRSKWFTLNQNEQESGIQEAFRRFTSSIGGLLIIAEDALKSRMKMIDTPPHTKHALHKKLLTRFPHSVILDTGDDIFVYQEGRTSIELFYETFRSPLSSSKPERGMYLLPFHLCTIQNAHLLEEGPVSNWYKACFATDLSRIPLYAPLSIGHLIHVMNENVFRTKNVRGAKQPFTVFGMPSPVPTSSLRSVLGKWYDMMLARILRTPLAPLLRTKNFHMTLPA